jgi:hypothetical protein
MNKTSCEAIALSFPPPNSEANPQAIPVGRPKAFGAAARQLYCY